MSQDMTFCDNKKCKYTKCKRHYSKIDWSIMPPWRSFASLEGTKYCLIKKGGVTDTNVGDKEKGGEE